MHRHEGEHDEAEEMTDRLCATALAQALDPSKLASFEAGVLALRTATPRAAGDQARGGVNLGTATVKGCSTGGSTPRPGSILVSPPRTCGAARSARRPVKAEVAGSDTVRSATKFRPAPCRSSLVTRSGSSVGRARA